MSARAILLAAMVAVAFPAAAADRIRIADEGKLGSEWTLVPGTQLMPPYPEAYAKDPEEVCLVVGYLVNTDGTTSDFSLLKSWTSGSNARNRNKFWGEFADLSSRALSQWRYAPAAPGARPVYTAATFVFGTPGAAAATKAHCEVASLTERLVELRYDPRAHRKMAGGIFSRLDIDPFVEERLRQRIAAQREMDSRNRDAAATQEMLQRAAAQPPPPSNK